MAKSLVIVESPAKAKTINKFLGSDYVVKPTGGHVIDLPEGDIGIDIENDFTPVYKTIKGKNKVLQGLKKAAKEADVVLLATDPDREGEAIAWHVANNVVAKGQPSYRVMINQITKDAVLKAVQDKGDLDLQKVYAQQARRILDRMVGYKVSPVLWSTIYKGLSAGRVQSVALRLIVERDDEIAAFDPKEYWTVVVILATGKNEIFEARLLKKDGKDLEIGSKEEADAIVDELSSLDFTVDSIAKKKKKRNATPPFITSTMQQAASSRLGFNVSRTMRIAQSLYEGIELSDGLTGLITYMRTDSTRTAPEAINEVREYVTNKWGADYLPSKPNYFKKKKGAQDAHEAIRPASLAHPPEKVQAHLSKEQFRLYSLIWDKFVASQMKPAEFSIVTIDVNAGPYGLRATSSHLDYKGYMIVYEDTKPENGDEAPLVDTLPELSKGDALKHNEFVPDQHFTKPPAHFSEAMLVKDLESRGIGRPSTYAQTINTIQTRKYVDREKNKLKATELGRSVNKILVENMPHVFDPSFTASMEEELDKIESGDFEWVKVVKDFYGPFNESLEKMKLKKKELKQSMIETTDEACEKCGEPMIIRWGRNGKFMACSGFPACKNTKPLEAQEVETTDEICEKCQSPMEVKTGRFGRFLACTNYPDCKTIKSYTLGVKCPEEDCKGEVVERKSKRGRLFYGCNKYPECKFASWTKPVAVPCPECESVTVTEAKNGESYFCPRCKHTFDKDMEESVATEEKQG